MARAAVPFQRTAPGEARTPHFDPDGSYTQLSHALLGAPEVDGGDRFDMGLDQRAVEAGAHVLRALVELGDGRPVQSAGGQAALPLIRELIARVQARQEGAVHGQ